jgi:hypothetical protein
LLGTSRAQVTISDSLSPSVECTEDFRDTAVGWCGVERPGPPIAWSADPRLAAFQQADGTLQIYDFSIHSQTAVNDQCQQGCVVPGQFSFNPDVQETTETQSSESESEQQMPNSLAMTFQVNSYIPAPSIATPQSLQLKGNCVGAAFTRITMGISTGNTVSAATDPSAKLLSINAKQDSFDQLCASLSALPVQLTINYTLENSFVCVNAISTS